MSTYCYAAKLFLKNGSIVEGEIIENTGYAVRVKIGDKERTIFSTDILRIVREDEELFGKTKEEKEAEKLYAEKKELVLRLLTANQAMEGINLFFKQLIDQAPKETHEELKKIFKINEIMDQVVPIYIKHYSIEELRDIVNFYTSPSGVKHVKITPIIMEETMRTTYEYFQKRGEDYKKKLEKESESK